MTLEALVHGEQVNAILGWASTTVIGVAAIESLLTNAYLWGCLVLLVVAIIALPAMSSGQPSAMVPWPLPLVAAMAVVLRIVGVYPEITGYVMISSAALLIVVDLNVFTAVELSRRVAVVFAVLTTMALQGMWTIAQFYSDRWLGTIFLRSQTELQ